MDTVEFHIKPAAFPTGTDTAVEPWMGCRCGDPGCWPLTVDIVLTPETVGWQHFRNGHRSWDLPALGPFRFATSDYLAALERTSDGPDSTR
ncbi:hypothetical protein [Frankia sp. ACN1ag]|uniref:hypothetical protein n=1 Tax=Frankia sp. ACN1ag TaxID=102891 RepID=UPI0006DC97BF|nr:hypothetical protein [Frankia sp. ACN1ag]